jgi:hypothetical protein
MDAMDAKFEKRFDESDRRFERFEKSFYLQSASVNARLDDVLIDTPRRTEHDRLAKRVEVVEKKVASFA